MAIPNTVLAAGWVPFVVVLLLTLFFSFIYLRYFQSRYDSELSSTLTSIFGLAVSLLTMALVPIDIFLVSNMKTPDGNFKHWAENKTDRDSITDSVMYAYYALYALELLFLVVLLPFAYFFYEEGDEETTTKSRVCTAVKFTACFMFVATTLMVVGVFAPLKVPANINGTEWDRFKNIVEELKSTNVENSLSFTISSLTLAGIILLIVYTGYGLSAWPMDLVKGRRSASKEHADVLEERSHAEGQINAIRSKHGRGTREMSRRDRRHLEELEENVAVMNRRERILDAAERSCLQKCLLLLRPFQIVFGVLLLLLTLLVFLSLLLTNIDKLLNSLGPKMGYALPERKLPNPIDIILVFAQKVFPLDYILLGGLVLFLFFSSMGGLQHIGVWFCWIRMYKIRPHRTKPQGLLMLIFLLIFIVLAMNVLLYQLTPQYSTYGNQHYIKANSTNPVPCSTDAPPGRCVMSRMSILLVRFFYKVWFFGAAYFWGSWAFLLVMLISFVVVLVRKKRSSVEGAVDRDDIDSDEDIIPA